MNLHESGEMYLESIFVLKNKMGAIRSIDLGEYMGYSKPSISRAVSLLKQGDFITVSKEGYIDLTEKGLAVAKKIFDRKLTELVKKRVQIGSADFRIVFCF